MSKGFLSAPQTSADPITLRAAPSVMSSFQGRLVCSLPHPINKGIAIGNTTLVAGSRRPWLSMDRLLRKHQNAKRIARFVSWSALYAGIIERCHSCPPLKHFEVFLGASFAALQRRRRF
jgi:hypothetical protein